MTDSFERDLALFIVELEGGYVNHPSDPGGETKYGISKRAYPDLDIANLTVEDACKIYERDYIGPVCNVVQGERLQALVSDAAVNHGLSRALEWFAVNPTVELFTAQRVRFYIGLSTFAEFGKGWMKRVARVLEWAHDRPFHVIVAVDNRPLGPRLAGASAGVEHSLHVNLRPMADKKGLKLDVA